MSARPRGINTTAATTTTPKNRPARLVISLDRNSEIAESENAPTTGPRIVPGSAEYRHDDHLDVQADIERAFRIDKRNPVGVNAACQRTENSRQGKCQRLV